MKRLLLVLLIFCLILNTTSVYAAPLSQALDYTSPQCAEIDEDRFRIELNQQVETFIHDEAKKTNLQSVVEQKWGQLKIDSAIDSEVDKAVISVKSNTGYWGRFISNWNPGQAKKLTQKIVDLVFENSPSVQNKFQQLSETVALDFSTKLETISVKSSTYAMECLQQFIGGQYSQPVVEIFNNNLKNSIKKMDSDEVNLNSDSLRFLNSHKSGIGGASYLLIKNLVAKKIINQITSRVAQQIGERIAGRIVETVIPIVDWIILVQAIGDFANPNAALNEIQNSLKKPDIKEKIKQEITDSIEKQLEAQSSAIAIQISSAIYGLWRDAKDRYGEALKFSKDFPEFIVILKTNPPKVSLLLEILLENTSRNGVRKFVLNGSFERLLSLPESTYSILKMPNGLPLLFDWVNLAGNKIEDVVRLELYKHKSPKDLDPQLLRDILSVQDPSTISKLSLLEVDSIRKLMLISKRNLVSVATGLDPNDLQQLANYLGGELEPAKINQLLKIFKDDLSVIKNPNLVKHILESKDAEAAIEFIKTPKSLWSLLKDTLGAVTGSVSWRLFFDKYGLQVKIFFMGIILLIVLLAAAIAMWFYRKWLEIRTLQKFLGNLNADQSGSFTKPGN